DAATVDVLKYFCRDIGVHQTGKKADLLARLKAAFERDGRALPNPHELACAQETVLAQSLLAKTARKRKADEEGGDSSEGQPVRKKRGTVEDAARIENEASLRQELELEDRRAQEAQARRDNDDARSDSSSRHRGSGAAGTSGGPLDQRDRRGSGFEPPETEQSFQSSAGPNSSLHSRSHSMPESVLGRRNRQGTSLDDWEWTPRSKRRLMDCANSSCDEQGTSAEDRQSIVAISQEPLPVLLISALAKQSRQRQAVQEADVQNYLASPSFKSNVTNKLQSTLLDPKLSSYVKNMLTRCMRHIRLHPGTYHTPSDMQEFVSSELFAVHLSRILTRARAQLRKKLIDGKAEEKDIYSLMKSLAFKSSFEVNDEHWGRKKKALPNTFWAFVDDKLNDRRKEALKLPEDERKAHISR
ncbi:hypothetical protein PLICRDRAFT_33277, partial [Plicaturopsis crispa FD-325 SS-3]